MTAPRHRNGLIARLRASYAAGKPDTLGPVPPSDVSRHLSALRRAATIADLGVRITRWETPDGVLITFQARDRAHVDRAAS